MQLTKHAAIGPIQQFHFQGFDGFPKGLQDRIGLIHDGIDECIKQKIRAELTQAPTAVLKPFAHLDKRIIGAFADADHKILPQKQADVGDVQIVHHQNRHAKHHEQVLIVLVDFGPLPDVGDVFQSQGMEAETLAEQIQLVGIWRSLDMHP